MDSILVRADGRMAGTLDRGAYSCSFAYAGDSGSAPWVSLTMPFREKEWTWMSVLHPAFEMHIPEGFVHAALWRRVASELGRSDAYSFLKFFAGSARGRLGYACTDPACGERPVPRFEMDEVVSFGSGLDFDRLAELCMPVTFFSGVQPKVLVELVEHGLPAEYLVKAWDRTAPRNAENEFFCMKAAQRSGIPVPDFRISQDAGLYLIRRFDVGEGGERLGFEDLCALQGKNHAGKYLGSYEEAARTIAEFASPERRLESLSLFFRMLCVSVLVRNGNAHLKNFGILYGEGLRDRRLAPAFDIVTTAVPSSDAGLSANGMALALAATRRWPGKRRLVDFGAGTCLLSPAEASRLYEECAAAVLSTREDLMEYCDENPEFRECGRGMLAAWESGLSDGKR